MIRESLADTRTALARVDPRFRVVLAIAFSVVVALSRAMDVQLVALGIAGGLYLGAGLPLRVLVRRLVVVNGFIAFLWLVLPFSVPGPVVLDVGFLQASSPGIMHALQITLKANAIIIVCMALVATMSVIILGNALQSLGVPPKICQLLLMTYRYIFVFEEESGRMHRAAVLRGFTPTTSMHTYRTYAYMVGMILVRAWERARRVHAAMICRGFRGRLYGLTTYRAVAGDWLFFACGAVVIVLLGILELAGCS
ncbi:cobalt ECF transporter T component CbiQ [Desulfoplanes formicivorans]|uniref:Cobalt ABC transporter permease n=1 Tax=Desulfoplanes formicivorans TaxID=1592317 RepID=A0A194AHR7_9BACT|nr:cobalt ECF transporter T component CbiQ [Desulfoplanes formicivorans]GAU08868.1 cobalt ABC transporter permease [Desulfoplanes formicivorans]